MSSVKKKSKSLAQLRWVEECRLRRIDEKWERAEEFFSRPMFLSARAMAPHKGAAALTSDSPTESP